MTFRKCKPYLTRFLIAFFITVVFCVILLIGVFLAAIMGYFGGVEDLDIPMLTSEASSQIYYVDEDGKEQLITTLTAEQNKIWVDSKKIPQDLKDAFVAIEDERFYQHSGVDYARTSKALFAYVSNKLSGGNTTFGGSTITQQLVKNLTGDDDQTAARKIREISQAVNLEKKLTKDKILELYMNSIYLSQGCTGVQAASQKFFGKPVNELTLAECASIAGITQYPSYYDPIMHPENNREKQKVVLQKMLELGYITKAEHDEAVEQELVFGETGKDNSDKEIQSYFVDQVIYDLLDELNDMGYSEILASRIVYTGGLKIITTLDPHVQETMEKIYEDPTNFPNGTNEIPIQSAMVVIDPHNGEVKGIVGGIGEKPDSLILNRASQSFRQPGSTFKPIAVYAPAMEDGLITAASTYFDEEVKYDGWTPYNYSRTFSNRPITVREALKRSLNTIPVSILKEYGPESSYQYLTQKLGISSLVEFEEDSNGRTFSDIGLPQLALGGLTHGVSPLELTAAYTPFANDGLFSKPHCIRTVTDQRGNVLIKNDPKFTNAMSEETAYIMSRMMHEVVSSSGGTGIGAALDSGMYTAGKTGTTSDNNDRWFVGFTPYYVSTVWYGYDTPKPIYASGNPCIPIWKSVMTEIHKDKPVITEPEVPSDVSTVSYCMYTGRMSSRYCAMKNSFVFDDNNLPDGYCNSNHTRSHTTSSDRNSKKNNSKQSGVSSRPSSSPIKSQPSTSSPSSSQSSTPSASGNSNRVPIETAPPSPGTQIETAPPAPSTQTPGTSVPPEPNMPTEPTSPSDPAPPVESTPSTGPTPPVETTPSPAPEPTQPVVPTPAPAQPAEPTPAPAPKPSSPVEAAPAEPIAYGGFTTAA